jgi:hypothetical protein
MCYLQKMMCDFIARTNWSNIESNCFVHTIIIFNLSYYTNIYKLLLHSWIIWRCAMHSFCSFQSITRTSPVTSSTSICTCLIFTQKFLTAPSSLTMWSGWLSFKMNLLESHTAKWIIFAVTGISICSPLLKTPFTTIVLDNFLLSMKGLSLTNWLPFPSFFWTWCDKQCCQARLRCLNRGQWFFEWGSFLQQAHCYQNQWNTALMKAAIKSNANTGNHTLIFWTMLGFFILEKQLASQDIFLIRSELIIAHLFLLLYRSTSLQSLSFLKNIETFLCK